MMTRETMTAELDRLVSRLGLVSSSDQLFAGKVEGFPIGLKIIAGENPLLLFQIRFPHKEGSKTGDKLDYGAKIKDLVSEKKIEVSVEDSIAWLSIIDSESLLADGSVIEVLYSVLGALKTEGLCGQEGMCHYCQVQKVGLLTCRDGKVAQICYACLDKKQELKKAAESVSAARKAAAFALVPFAAVVGAFAWAVAWLAYDYIVGILNVRVIVIPRIIELAVLTVVAVAVGGPVGFVLRKIPKHGDWLGGFAVILFAIATVVMGEILYVVWLIYREYKTISFAAAVKILPRTWIDLGGIALAEKIGVAAVSVVAAYHFARPKEKGVSL